MSDDRADRLRESRNRAKQKARDSSTDSDVDSDPVQQPGSSESSELSEQSKPSELSKPSEQSEQSDTSGQAEDHDGGGSVKDDQIGTYMYLPESQHQALSRQFNLLKAEYEFEFDTEFEKNRHFYPLIVKYGLDSLDNLDAEEIHALLEELDGVDL